MRLYIVDRENRTDLQEDVKKVVRNTPALNPSCLLLDFERAAINVFEEEFLAVLSGCFFHFSQNIYRKIQSLGLTNQYMESPGFALYMRMLPSLAFVSENEVCDCFLILMGEFPQDALEVAEYFETTYLGRRLPDQTRRTPPFPIRFGNMYARVLNRTSRTNNCVEGWHNAFQTGITISHPSFPKLVNHFQREQALQDAKYAKWEGGNRHPQTKSSKERNERLYNLVIDYEKRDTITFFKWAKNPDFDCNCKFLIFQGK